MSDRNVKLELSDVLLEELETQMGTSPRPSALPATAPRPVPRKSEEAQLRKEAERSAENRRRKEAFARIYAEAPERAALCLSGGGIRSASFSLGVLQALAKHGLLKQFDFLSTVSGGGYIGGWLSAWIKQSGGNVAAVEAALAAPPAQPLEPEPAPVRHLRTFSNYLAPKLGLFSADTWTLIATVVRNLLLNWLVLLSLLVAAMTAPFFTPWAINAQPDPWMLRTLLIGAFVAITAALAYPAADLPGIGNLRGRQRLFVGAFLLPLVGGVLLLAAWWAGFRNTAPKRWFGWRGDLDAPLPDTLFDAGVWPGGALAAMIFLGAACLCGSLLSVPIFLKCGKWQDPSQRWRVVRHLAFVMLPLNTAMGVLGGWGVTFFATAIFPNPARQMIAYAIGGPPLLLGAFFALTTLFIGLSSFRLGDEDREWWGRGLGWIGIATVAWVVPHALMLYATTVVTMYGRTWWDTALTASGGALGIAAAIWGFSTRTEAKKETVGRSPLGALLPAAVAVGFFLLLGCGISWLIVKVALEPTVTVAGGAPVANVTPRAGSEAGSAKQPLLTVYRESDKITAQLAPAAAPAPPPFNPLDYLYAPSTDSSEARLRFLRMLGLVFVLTVLGLVMGCFINVNKFSLHSMYRNRLVRAFLGASRARVLEADSAENLRADGSPPPDIREPHPFTGFDPHDNVDMCTLSQRKLFHVVNMALNIVHGEELAWQERMASSFTASPLHCGNWRVGFRPSAEYGKRISLGTAVAISGAAASPNAGYHSSPVVTFLMTLFNLRLGWWLGNPGTERAWQRAGPVHAAWPLLAEALGHTREESSYINLSDGGHFENLGVYEMVLRRCRRILAIDGGCDTGYTFEDLGNLIRKVRIDFGIEIKITLTRLIPLADEKRRFAESSVGPLLYCARGTIGYHEVDGTPAADDGELIYIKPMMTDAAPADVANYHSAHPDFPHEPTGDQFFSESQLESYRALGAHQLQTVVGADWPAAGSLADLFARARRYAAPTDPALVASTLSRAGAKSSS